MPPKKRAPSAAAGKKKKAVPAPAAPAPKPAAKRSAKGKAATSSQSNPEPEQSGNNGDGTASLVITKQREAKLKGRLDTVLLPQLAQADDQAGAGAPLPNEDGDHWEYAGDHIGDDDRAQGNEEDDAVPKSQKKKPAPKKGKPSPKKASAKKNKQQDDDASKFGNVDYAQLFQALCLSVRLELASKKQGPKLDAHRIVLDDGFIARMEMMHPGEVIRLETLVKLGDLLPDQVTIYRPLPTFGEAGGFKSAFGAAPFSPSEAKELSVRLKIDSIPTPEQVNAWLEERQAKAATEVVASSRGKRSRDDEVKKTATGASAVTPGDGGVDSSNNPNDAALQFKKDQHQASRLQTQQTRQAGATPRPRGNPMANLADNDLSKFLSEERMATLVEPKATLEEAEQQRLEAQLQVDYDRLVPMYDQALSIVGPCRRCYAIPRLEVELVGLSRRTHQGKPEDISRQLRMLMAFPDSGMAEMQPKRLFELGGDSESDDAPATAGGGTGTPSEEGSVNAAPGLLILDATKANRLRLCAAVERKKAELLAHQE